MHHPVFDCSFQKWMVRKPGFYHMIDVSVYLSRQRGEMSLVEKTHFTKPFFILNQECVMNVMIVHALLCNLFLYKLFMHSCVVAESTLCMLSSVLLSFLSRINPLESTSTQSQNIAEWYFFFCFTDVQNLRGWCRNYRNNSSLFFALSGFPSPLGLPR